MYYNYIMYQYGEIPLFLQDIIAYTAVFVNSFAKKFIPYIITNGYEICPVHLYADSNFIICRKRMCPTVIKK